MDKYTYQDAMESVGEYLVLDQTNTELKRKALKLAQKIHAGQLRDEGTPYIDHIHRVAQMVSEHGDDIDVIVALLHDVVEDSDLTITDIESEFGEEIAAAVGLLTKRKDLSFDDYMAAIAADSTAVYVKLADRLDNIQSLKHCGKPEKVSRYLEETCGTFLPAVKKSEAASLKHFRDLIRGIEEECHKYFLSV